MNNIVLWSDILSFQTPVINNLYELHRVVRQKSMLVSVNTTIRVKVMTTVIYININHDMFRPLLCHHQVYLCVRRC
jgi:hypothetical protein